MEKETAAKETITTNSSSPSSYTQTDYHHVLPKPEKTTHITTCRYSRQQHPHPRYTSTWHLKQVVQEIKELYSMALPMIITGLILYGKSLISMVFMGRLGKDMLAGASLSMGFANITGYSVLFGLSTGMEAITSQAYGAKQWQLMSLSLHRTIVFLMFISMFISLLWWNVGPILIFLGQNSEIASIASTYLTFSLPDLVFLSILNPLKIYLRSQNITKPLMHSSLVVLLLHAPINYFLVHYLQLGIKGIAIAGSLANLNLVISLVLYIYFCQKNRECWESWSLECFREWKPILRLAIPSCASVCLEWWWYEFMILISGLLTHATESVATMGILIQATSLVYIFPSALSMAISTRVGNELGASRPERAESSTRIAILCSVFTGFLAMLFTVTVRDVWGHAFTGDKSIISLTAMTMPVIGLCELGNCTQTTGCGVLRGSARPSLGANINMIAFYGVGMPLAVIMGLVMKMGLLGLWLGLLAAQATCAVVMVFAVMRTNWTLEAEKAKELTGTDMEHKQREEETNAPLLERYEDCC